MLATDGNQSKLVANMTRKSSDKQVTRRFIRHPADIPIEIRRSGDPPSARPRAYDVSLGGLAFQTNARLAPGTIVEVLIPTVQPKFRSKARVRWCNARQGTYEVGVEFLDARDAYRARMVEQVCHIENYKNEVYRAESRVLTAEEAAREWIVKFASQFPTPGASDENL